MEIKTWNNQTINLDLAKNLTGNLIVLPALIDPHVHFRTPGAEHKEDWTTASQAAIAGGVTTVLDMPNNDPAVIDEKALEEKKMLIEGQLDEADIPLHYGLYFGATNHNFDELKNICKSELFPKRNAPRVSEYLNIKAIKLFMGSSTGNLLVDKKVIQDKWFALAAKLNLPIAVHAEDEEIIKEKQVEIQNPKISDHSKIRPRGAAIKAVEQAIEMAEKHNTTLYILHLSTKEEIDLVRQAKAQGLKVYAEVTPHHLFLNEDDYESLGSKAQMNPPLRTKADNDALWAGIADGTVDTIGTDHAPHTLEEKNEDYPNSPSGIPGIETYLPLLLDAYNQGKISLENIVKLTRTNPQKIFNLEDNNDWVIIDLDLEKEVEKKKLKTKCGWSPFAGTMLRGWPVATILSNKTYLIN